MDLILWRHCEAEAGEPDLGRRLTPKGHKQAERMAGVLRDATRAISQAMPRLRTLKDIHHYTVEVNRLENEGDRMLRSALASLFEQGIDPMMVIRWKDIFERLEDAIDSTETAVNILEGIIIKNR